MDEQPGSILQPYFWQRGFHVEMGVSTSVDLNKISLEDFERVLDHLQAQIDGLYG